MGLRKIDLAVCLCSRGLIHSRTAESLDRALHFWGGTYLQRWTHDDKIPIAQENVTEQALAWGPEWLLYLEEDMLLPQDAIAVMMSEAALDTGINALTARYLLEGDTWAHVCSTHDEKRILYGGMGCLLVRAAVFPQLQRPWFDDRYRYDWINGESCEVMRRGFRLLDYGGHDVHFYAILQMAGYRIHLSSVECQHLRVRKFGKPNHNDGCHRIEPIGVKQRIEKGEIPCSK